MAEQKLAVCPRCGRRYTAIGQLAKTYQLGAALRGVCSCDQHMGISQLWEVSRRENLATDQDQEKTRQMSLFSRL